MKLLLKAIAIGLIEEENRDIKKKMCFLCVDVYVCDLNTDRTLTVDQKRYPINFDYYQSKNGIERVSAQKKLAYWSYIKFYHMH